MTVVTGANGSGKSTLLRALDLVRAAVRVSVFDEPADLDSAWAAAGHAGARRFEVRVGIRFDAPDERALIDAYHRSAVLYLLYPKDRPKEVDALQLANAIERQLPDDPAAPMIAGELVVLFDERQRRQWTIGWQFDLPHGPAHVQLAGSHPGTLVDGVVRFGPIPLPAVVELPPVAKGTAENDSYGVQQINLWETVKGNRVRFNSHRQLEAPMQPPSMALLLKEIRPRADPSFYRLVHFAEVMHTLLTKRLQVTDNHRAAVRTQFSPDDLTRTPDLQDGSELALELYRLKNGSAADRHRFATVQEFFRQITGERVDCNVQTTQKTDAGTAMQIVPTVEIRTGAGESHVRDVPLQYAGAGATEALHFATLLADERRCAFLDEPGVHLSPTAQRRLLTVLRQRQNMSGQVLWVTHNPDLVPTLTADEMCGIIRMSRVSRENVVNSLGKDKPAAIAAMSRLLASNEVRGLLFASGVVLVEGETDAALIRWLNAGVADANGTLPTPDDRNVLFLPVDGHTAFGNMASLAERIGVPWAILADGPAMRPGSAMARQLARLGRAVPQAGNQLSDVRKAWADAGVHSLANEFGDDGSKSGEIEAFMRRVDSRALGRVQREVAAKKGRRVGAAFADVVPAPAAVATLWAAMLETLGLPR